MHLRAERLSSFTPSVEPRVSKLRISRVLRINPIVSGLVLPNQSPKVDSRHDTRVSETFTLADTMQPTFCAFLYVAPRNLTSCYVHKIKLRVSSAVLIYKKFSCPSF